jgi:hypothetical protein
MVSTPQGRRRILGIVVLSVVAISVVFGLIILDWPQTLLGWVLLIVGAIVYLAGIIVLVFSYLIFVVKQEEIEIQARDLQNKLRQRE